MRTFGRTSSLLAGVLFAAVATVSADPVIVLGPVSSAEIVDFTPIDGLDLRSAPAEFVSGGPLAETRVVYHFELNDLSAASPRTPIVFSATRTGFPFSSCAGLSPCPPLTQFDVYGFAADGEAGIDDYDRGVFLHRFPGLPAPGQSFNLDVTGFVGGLREGNARFAGFVVRPASIGAMELSQARLAATPEPASLTLLALGSAGLFARRLRSKGRDRPR